MVQIFVRTEFDKYTIKKSHKEREKKYIYEHVNLVGIYKGDNWYILTVIIHNSINYIACVLMCVVYAMFMCE